MVTLPETSVGCVANPVTPSSGGCSGRLWGEATVISGGWLPFGAMWLTGIAAVSTEAAVAGVVGWLLLAGVVGGAVAASLKA